MKAQFATIESLISLSLIIAFIYFGSTLLNGSNASFYSSSKTLSLNAAGYDFVHQLYQNQTFDYCFSQVNSSARYACIENYLKEYAAVYQTNNIAFVVGNATFGNSSQTNSILCAQFAGIQAGITTCLLGSD